MFGQLRQISFNSEDWYQPSLYKSEASKTTRCRFQLIRGCRIQPSSAVLPKSPPQFIFLEVSLRASFAVANSLAGLDVSEYDYIPVAKLLPGEPADASSYNGASTTVYAEERMQVGIVICWRI